VEQRRGAAHAPGGVPVDYWAKNSATVPLRIAATDVTKNPNDFATSLRGSKGQAGQGQSNALESVSSPHSNPGSQALQAI